MESKFDKREAARQFKERKVAAGAYAVRCSQTGAVWVGVARNLDAARNACWFSLRMHGHRVASLQAAWDVHGETAFTFEVLETLPEDAHPLGVNDLLKGLKSSWMENLNALPLL